MAVNCADESRIGMADVAVTVLVPVYNTQKYLRHCLDSLAAQTLTSVKFLCIDDGSTDESAEILSEYADADPVAIPQ